MRKRRGKINNMGSWLYCFNTQKFIRTFVTSLIELDGKRREYDVGGEEFSDLDLVPREVWIIKSGQVK